MCNKALAISGSLALTIALSLHLPDWWSGKVGASNQARGALFTLLYKWAPGAREGKVAIYDGDHITF